MTSVSPSPVSVGETEVVAPPFPPAPVEEVLRLVGKATRAHQLYLPNNPIYKGAIDAVRTAFSAIWSHTDELVLSFTETDIKWFGQPVLNEPSKSSDSLPWIFYKDGVREINLQKGFEQEEIVRLLDILQRVRKASPEEDDLLTLLWGADFTFLRYRYVDLGMESAAPLADGSELQAVDAQQVQGAAHAAVEESRTEGVVNMSDFDATLYFLDEHEIEYLQTEIRREYQEDLRSKVSATLLDIFEQQASTEVRAEIIEILDGLLVHLLTGAEFRGVAYLLREVQTVAQRAPELQAEHRQKLLGLANRLSAPDALAQMLQSLDDAPELPPSTELSELFEQLRPTALATVFGWLKKLQNARLRPLLESAAERLASANTTDLVRLILAPEHDVAVEAVRRAASLKTPAAVQSLSKVLDGKNVELRQLAVHALTEIGSAGALQALERAVEDSDREVRIATVRAFAARGYKPVLERLETVVKGKAIREADLTEKMSFFEAYGALCGDSGLEYLDALLNGKGFLGRREDAEVRACAAFALGRVGSVRAMESLRKAAGEKDVVVRNAVNRALRGATA